jgi:hypothetical protein
MEVLRAQGVALATAIALLLSACADDLSPPYDCTVAAVRAQAELPPGRWSRLLMAQYHDVAMGHTYMVFDTLDGHLFAYDSVFGSRPIFPRSRDARDVAAAVDPRVETAWFVEETTKGKPRGTPGVARQDAGNLPPPAMIALAARPSGNRPDPAAQTKQPPPAAP